MEKQSATTISKFPRRLLILFTAIFSLYNLSAEKITPEIISTLSIIPSDKQEIFTGQDINFEVFIPYVESDKISITQPQDTKDITFKNIRCLDSTIGISGSRITLRLEFKNPGSYTPSPLSLKIQGKKYSIPLS